MLLGPRLCSTRSSLRVGPLGLRETQGKFGNKRKKKKKLRNLYPSILSSLVLASLLLSLLLTCSIYSSQNPEHTQSRCSLSSPSLMETLLVGSSPTAFSSEAWRSYRRATITMPHWRKPIPSRIVCMAVSNFFYSEFLFFFLSELRFLLGRGNELVFYFCDLEW